MAAPARPGGPVRGTRLLRFFVPLALTTLLINVTHSVLNAGLARLPTPEVSLAAYAVAKSMVLLVENPIFMVRQTVVALVRSRASYFVVTRLMYVLAGTLALSLLLLGFTPAGPFLLGPVLGLQGEALRQGVLALGVLWILPLASSLRNLYQGVAILAGANALVPVATAARLVALGLCLWLAEGLGLPGALVGAAAFVLTMGVEAAFLATVLVRRYGRPDLVPALSAGVQEGGDLTARAVAGFFLPLALTSLVMTVTQPVLQGGIARTGQPELQLAAFSVAWGLASLFWSPLTMLHQVSLAFGGSRGEPGNRSGTGRFAAQVAVVLTGCFALVAYGPPGPWVVETVIGVPPQVGAQALLALQVLAVATPLEAVREHFWGLLMARRRTRVIGRAKLLNLAGMVSLLAAVLLWVPLPPAAGAGLAVIGGNACEAVALSYAWARLSPGPGRGRAAAPAVQSPGKLR